jgi:RNA polymerase sigma factor FliA
VGGVQAQASADARERLILHYAPLVKYVAGRVSVGLPPNIEQADLVSYGIFGLIDAIEKYDLERGIKFETYAISRIKARSTGSPGRCGSRRARSRRPTPP